MRPWPRAAAGRADLVALGLPWLVTGAVFVLVWPPLWWDEWALAAWSVQARRDGLDLASLWRPHNEHRIVLWRVLAYVSPEQGPAALVPRVASWLVAGGTLWLLAPQLRAAGAALSPGRRAVVLLASSAFYFSSVQWNNFLFGMQVWCALFGMLLAALAMVEPREVQARWRAALGVGVAYLSSAHWLVLIPLLLGGELWRLRTRDPAAATGRASGAPRPIVLAAVSTVLLVLYLRGLTLPEHHPDPLHGLTHPLEMLDFLQRFYGSPFSVRANPPWSYVDRAMGTLFVLWTALLVVLAARGRRRGAVPSVSAATLATLALVHGVALLTGIGRAGFGAAAATASRYTTFMILGWLVVLAAALRLGLESRAPLPRLASRAIVVAVAFHLALGLAVSAATLERLVTRKLPELSAACACLREAVAEPELRPGLQTCLRPVFPDPAGLHVLARQMPPRWLECEAPADHRP
jgi:hypothetical protein